MGSSNRLRRQKGPGSGIQVLKIPKIASSPPAFFYAGVPVVVTAALWATSRNDVSLSQMVAALLLCWIPWAAYQRWSNGMRRGIPLLFLVGAVYWAAYALPLFWLRHEITLVTGGHQLSEDAITQALYLAVLGVAALGVGM